jgi:uncharacterized protein (TIGR03546 family)
MTLLLKQIFGLFKLLNSETGANQIAAGISFGLIIGFSPILSLQVLLAFILLLIFRIQIGAAFLSAFFFKFIAFLLDPIADRIGRAVLENAGLRPLYITLYNMPLIPLTRFNNSIVMGSGITAIILTIPIFILSKRLIVKYRETVIARIKGTKWWRAMQATSFFKWYASYEKLKS